MKHIIKLTIDSTEETFEISEEGTIQWTSDLVEMNAIQRERLIRLSRRVASWLRVNGGVKLEVEEEA